MRTLQAYYSNKWFIAFVLDLVLVIVFATIGRASHELGITLDGVFQTAWPFALALIVAWVMMSVLRMRQVLFFPAGIVIWVVTVAGGMLMRDAVGEGTALAFVLVASGTLAAFLLVPRILLGRKSLIEAPASEAAGRAAK